MTTISNSLYLKVSVLIVISVLISSISIAGRFDSDDPSKKPLSVSLSEIEERINNDEHADGIKLAIKQKEGNLHVDLLAIPGKTSVAASTRVVFMIGRLAEPDYMEMWFDDVETSIFKIDGDVIREIGSQFVWAEKDKGQNPIALIRKFMDNLRTIDGQRVAEPMTGSLLGDTTKAMNAMNHRFIKEWVMGTTEVLSSE